jgi:hypothetical protein
MGTSAGRESWRRRKVGSGADDDEAAARTRTLLRNMARAQAALFRGSRGGFFGRRAVETSFNQTKGNRTDSREMKKSIRENLMTNNSE